MNGHWTGQALTTTEIHFIGVVDGTEVKTHI